MTRRRLFLAAFAVGCVLSGVIYHQTQAMRGLIADFRASIEATIVEAYK